MDYSHGKTHIISGQQSSHAHIHQKSSHASRMQSH